MRRVIPTLLVAVLLAGPVLAGDDGLSGNWKLSLIEGSQQTSLWLLHIESKDGKLKIAATKLKNTPEVEVGDVRLVGDTFSFEMKGHIVQQGQKATVKVEFEGKLPKPGAKRILGNVTFGGSTGAAVLEIVSAKSAFELDRDLVAKTPSDPKAFDTIIQLIHDDKNKIDAKDMNDWVNSSVKAAELYGPRFGTIHQFRLIDSLVERPAYSKVGVELARKIGNQFQADDKRPLGPQLELVTLIHEILRTSEHKDEAKTLAPKLDKLEVLGYNEHAREGLSFKLDKFAGRKTKTNRAVLVELFTGAQCPPCVAADLAFDGLGKTYKSAEVVLLQYHMHIPAPEPLANADSDARFEYYQEVKGVQGTPSALFNGRPAVRGGGSIEEAPEIYTEYCKAINKIIDLPELVNLSATATRSGDKISITAKVKDLAAPGDKTRLRLVLVEDWAHYQGRNQLSYHHRVVRAMPGGAKGFTLKQKDAEHTVDVDLEKVRKSINTFLDERYRDGVRPMRMRDLHVVAFVQNDDTNEVLHAIDVAVVEKK